MDLITEPLDFNKADALVGEILDGRFLIKKNLTEGGADKGGIGLVYLAEDLKLLSKETVVKILKSESLGNEDVTRKFLHEKEALIRLDHPNIVRILDAGKLSDNNSFMVMDFIPGHSLRHALRKSGKLPFDFCAHITKQVTDALSAAHAKNILHRDIKPENIMLTPRNDEFDRVRLIDFGVARVGESKLAPATTVERGIGTLLYMAPEQLIGTLEQTPTVDIYAFALVAYEMLTGQRLFNPKSVVEMYQLQQEGLESRSDELFKELPESVVGLLLSALEFKPEKRPQHARRFGLELARALLDESKSLESPYPSKFEDSEITETFVPPERKNDDLKFREKSEENQIRKTKPLPEAGQNFSEKKTISEKREMSSQNKIIEAGLGLVLLMVIAGFAGIAYWRSLPGDVVGFRPAESVNENTSLPTENLPSHEIPFYLDVQKMRNGKQFEKPFRSSGRHIYENGDEFRLVFESIPQGYFYIFNEGSSDGAGDNPFYILFPTPMTNEGLANEGSAQVIEGQKIETENNRFDEIKGTELVWIIWTKAKNSELENIRDFAFDDDEGKVSDKNAANLLREFLSKFKNVKSEEDSAKRRTVIKGQGDVLVHKILLEHR